MTRLWIEIGLTHGGSLPRAYDLITQIAKAGADVVKVQAHHEAEGDHSEVDREGKPRDWAATAFTREQWARLIGFAHDRGLEVVASVFCVEAVDLLDGLVDGFKVPSGQIVNGELWKRLEATGKPLAASYGMRDDTWLIENVFIDSPMPDHTRLHCVSQYPTALGSMGWERVKHMAYIYHRMGWGLSDHSGTIWPSIMAATLGASVVEVHYLSREDETGPDAASSLNWYELAQLASAFKAIDEIRHSGEWSPAIDLRSIYEPRWFKDEGKFRKSTSGEPPENWWKNKR